MDQGRCSASGGTYLVSLSESLRCESNRLCRSWSASAIGSLPRPAFWRQQDLYGCPQVVSVRRGALPCASRSTSSECLSESSYPGGRTTRTISPLRWAVVVAWCGRVCEGAGCSGDNRLHVSTSPRKACTPKLQKTRTALRWSRLHPSRTEISYMTETQIFALDQRAVPNVHNLAFDARRRS